MKGSKGDLEVFGRLTKAKSIKFISLIHFLLLSVVLAHSPYHRVEHLSRAKSIFSMSLKVALLAKVFQVFHRLQSRQLPAAPFSASPTRATIELVIQARNT